MDDIVFPTEQKPKGPTAEVDIMRKPGMGQVCMLFSIVMVILITIGSRVQKNDAYPGILITEFVLILIPALAFLFIYKYDFRKVLRINKISILTLVIIFGIMVVAMLASTFINSLYLLAIKAIFGDILLPSVPTAKDPLGILAGIIVIGMAPGICEEILFRGVIQRGFERFGAVRSILMTSILFGMFHLYFEKFLGTFLLGILIGFIAYRTNSIFGSMFAHFLNNSITVVVGFIYYKADPSLLDTDKAGEGLSKILNMTTTEFTGYIIGNIFILSILASVLAVLIYALIKVTPKRAPEVRKENIRSQKHGFLPLIPGAAIIVSVYILEGFRLRGMKFEVLSKVMKFIMGG
jgi:uncharacterized protein